LGYRLSFLLFAPRCERFSRGPGMCAFFYVIAILVILGLVFFAILEMYGLV
jgi:hypothetical protein